MNRLSRFVIITWPSLTYKQLHCRINSETEKDLVIRNLSTAFTHASAKEVVRKLRSYDNFSIQQLNDITEAFTANDQIHGIGDDFIIRKTREEIIESNSKKIDKDVYKGYIRRFAS